MVRPRLALFTRYPEPGVAKTRLIPALGATGAAALHKRLTERTVAVLRAAAPADAIEIHFTGASDAAFRAWLGDDLHYVAQPEGDLTQRLVSALAPAPVIFLGADTPDLSAAHVRAAIAALADHAVVIGPADDGGYYLIGMAEADDFLLTDIAWSTPAVRPETLRRCAARGIAPVLLEALADCDRPEDLARWPWLAAPCA